MRFLLPSPSFAFDGVRAPPEELVNSASAAATKRPGIWRSQVNQPDPAFPQSPGIILKRTTSILLSAVRFVLSMNWEQHTKIPGLAYQLISTTCPPKTTSEQRVNNADSPVKSRLPGFRTRKLFTENLHRGGRCEQVLSQKF